MNGHPTVIQLLINNEADVHARDNCGLTALDITLDNAAEDHQEAKREEYNDCETFLRAAMEDEDDNEISDEE